VLIAALAAVSLAFLGVLAALAARIRKRAPVSGVSAMVGMTGEVVEANGRDGWALVQGEHWRVRAEQPLRAGERVQVRRVDELTLGVAVEASPGILQP